MESMFSSLGDIVSRHNHDDLIVKITNLNTSEEIVKERDRWFAWYAFHPETELYQK
jgi:hypothetical protein